MAYVRPTSNPTEVVSLAEQKNFLRISTSQDDNLISNILIPAARSQAEIFTNQAIAQRNYVQSLDSFPYYVDTIMSQQAYPPNYYSNPRYSTTLWNYSQMLKLFRGPLTDVVNIEYVDGSGGTNDGTIQFLTEGVDFIVDPLNLQPRLFPLAGSFWPSVKYVPNAVQINFTAGYTPNPTDIRVVTVHTNLSSPYVPSAHPNQQTQYTYQIGVPYDLKMALMMLVNHWYLNREPVVSGQPGTLPMHVEDILWSYRVEDVSPTRG